MTTKIELLPLPEGEASSFGDYQVHDNEAMIDYARANVAHATAALHAEVEALRAEVERLSRYYKNGIACFANPCERHSGERTPPFAEFFEKYGGQCLICVVDNNKALQVENERLRAEIKKWEASFEQAASGHATYAEKTEQLLAENERLRAEVERLTSMTAVAMGVGSGNGNLFVHGSLESIAAAQAIVLERGALRAEVERLRKALKDADNEREV